MYGYCSIRVVDVILLCIVSRCQATNKPNYTILAMSLARETLRQATSIRALDWRKLLMCQPRYLLVLILGLWIGKWYSEAGLFASASHLSCCPGYVACWGMGSTRYKVKDLYVWTYYICGCNNIFTGSGRLWLCRDTLQARQAFNGTVQVPPPRVTKRN